MIAAQSKAQLVVGDAMAGLPCVYSRNQFGAWINVHNLIMRWKIATCKGEYTPACNLPEEYAAPPMETPLVRAIRDYLDRTGETAVGLSRACGMGDTWVKQILRGRAARPNAEALLALARIIGADPAQLMAGRSQSQPTQNDMGTPLPQVFRSIKNDSNVPLLPIYGAAEGGDGIMILDAEPIEWRERPINLRTVKTAFGVYVINDSMAPALEPGDIVYVHPGRPLKPGRDAVFLRTSPDQQMHVVVKRLVRSTEKSWRVEQFNPARQFDLPKNVWQKALRIVGIEKAD